MSIADGKGYTVKDYAGGAEEGKVHAEHLHDQVNNMLDQSPNTKPGSDENF